MPKTVIYTENLGSGVKSANLLAGDVNEFINYPAHIRVFSAVSAQGVNISIFADSDLLCDDKRIPYTNASLLDDHLIDEFDVSEGTRLAVFLRETAAAGTIDIFTAVEVTPL